MDQQSHLAVSECLQRISDAEAALGAVRSTLADLVRFGQAAPPSIVRRQFPKSHSPIPSVPATQQPTQTLASVSAAPVPATADRKCAEAKDITLGGESWSKKTSCEVATRTLSKTSSKGRPGSRKLQNYNFLDQVVMEAITESQATLKENDDAMIREVLSGGSKDSGKAGGLSPKEREQHGIFWKISASGCPVPVLHPECRFRFCWDLAGLFFILFETYAIPYFIAFDIDVVPELSALFVFLSAVDLYFILDLCLSFITAYRGEHSELVTNLHLIRRRYAKSWFLPDALSSIPWEWMGAWLATGGRYGQLTRMLRLLRIARLLRLFKTDVLTDNFKLIIESNSALVFISGVARVIFLLCGITHWAACMWYIVGANPAYGPSWTDGHVPANADPKEKYVYSVYFTLTTMTTVGYGDITPKNYTEVGFVSILLLVATVVFATLMGSLTDLIGNLNKERNDQKDHLYMLSRYMNWRSVPRDLFHAVRNHLVYLWETNKGYDAYEDEVKNQLPPVLRKELCYHIYGGILRSLPIFFWMRDFDICMKELATVVSASIFARGDALFRVGEEKESIRILLTGTVHISMTESLFSFKALDEDESDLKSDDCQDDDINMSIEVPSHLCQNTKVKNDTENISKCEMVHAVVLKAAALNMMERDKEARKAAILIQQRWRKKIRARGKSGQVQGGGKEMVSKSVTAPACFGESCLWIPLEEWGNSALPTFAYTAVCEMRCELVSIKRDDLKDVIMRFSPWLGHRFEDFREHVAIGLDKGAAGASSKGGTRKQPEAPCFHSFHDVAKYAMAVEHARQRDGSCPDVRAASRRGAEVGSPESMEASPEIMAQKCPNMDEVSLQVGCDDMARQQYQVTMSDKFELLRERFQAASRHLTTSAQHRRRIQTHMQWQGDCPSSPSSSALSESLLPKSS